MALCCETDIGPEEEILVTFIEGCCVHARLMKYDAYLLWEIHLKIVEQLAGPLQPTAKREAVLCSMKINGEMYVRAVIINTYPDTRALVELVDIGTKEVVHINELTVLPAAALAEYPPMAVRILLKDCAMLSQKCVGKLKDIEFVSIDRMTYVHGRLHHLPDSKTTRYELVPAYHPGADDCKPKSSKTQAVLESAHRAPQFNKPPRQEFVEVLKTTSTRQRTKQCSKPSKEAVDSSTVKKLPQTTLTFQTSAEKHRRTSLSIVCQEDLCQLSNDSSGTTCTTLNSTQNSTQNVQSSSLSSLCSGLTSSAAYETSSPSSTVLTRPSNASNASISQPSVKHTTKCLSPTSVAMSLGSDELWPDAPGSRRSSSARGPSPTPNPCSDELDPGLSQLRFFRSESSKPKLLRALSELHDVRLPRLLSAFDPLSKTPQPTNRNPTPVTEDERTQPEGYEQHFDVDQRNTFNELNELNHALYSDETRRIEHHQCSPEQLNSYDNESVDLIENLQRTLAECRIEHPLTGPELAASVRRRSIPPTFERGAYGFKVLGRQPAAENSFIVRHAAADPVLAELESQTQSLGHQLRLVDSLAVGDYVLAAFNDETLYWSRALVCEIDCDNVQVEYVDYGVYDWIRSSEIRELPLAYCSVRALAAQIMPTVELDVGKHYLALIEAATDYFGRVFNAVIPMTYPSTMSSVEDGLICSRNTFIIKGRTVFGVQKLQDMTELELEMTSSYSGFSVANVVKRNCSYNVGSRVVVECERVFCRASVTECDDQGAIVFLVDYGIVKHVNSESIFELKHEERQLKNNWQMRSFLCVLAENEQPPIGAMYPFRIRCEFSVYSGVVIYDASIDEID